MLHEVPVSPRQFATFRVLLGAYLMVHFAHLLAYGTEVFSRHGVLPDARLNLTYGLFPDPLYRWDSPAMVAALLATLCTAAALLTLGIARRAAAVVLWFGWAALFHRNNLISNPSIPYVGLLLLLTVLVPLGEGLVPRRRGGDGSGWTVADPDSDWRLPPAVYWTAWTVLAAGYTYSGAIKLGSPSWLDGTAFAHVLRNPLARPNAIRETLLALPATLLAVLTWGALATELAALPLSLWRTGRLVGWLSQVGMQLGILLVVSFGDLTAGMLLAHLFVVDPRWWSRRRAAAGTGPADIEAAGTAPAPE